MQKIKYEMLVTNKLYELTEKIFLSALLMPAEATQSFESFLTSLAAHFTANGGLNVNSTSLHKLALMITGQKIVV